MIMARRNLHFTLLVLTLLFVSINDSFASQPFYSVDESKTFNHDTTLNLLHTSYTIESIQEPDNEPLEIIQPKPAEKTVLANKISSEKEANENLFSLSQHKTNYILPLSYVSNPNTITLDGVGEENIENLEAKYQVSIKTPLYVTKNDLTGVYFAFTAVSYWQLYSDEISKPFRETNYEPELFYQFTSEYDVLGYQFNMFRIGINHMSNGQNGLKSRSWNRIIATALFSDESSAYYLKAWYRLPEDEKIDPLDPTGDDNPDITDYYGKIELGFASKLGNFNVFSRIRNNLSLSDNRSGIELDFSYQLNDRYDLLIQYFNGYGDSLIDYNRHQQRISLGFKLRFI